MGVDCIFTKRNRGAQSYSLNWSDVGMEATFLGCELGIDSALYIASLYCWDRGSYQRVMLRRNNDVVEAYVADIDDNDNMSYGETPDKTLNYYEFEVVLKTGIEKLKPYLEAACISTEAIINSIDADFRESKELDKAISTAIDKAEDQSRAYIAIFSFLIYDSLLFNLEQNNKEFEIFYG